MSSRSLAAARARRAGDTAPPVSGNRPGTSIGSHAAFSQNQQPNPPSKNVRVARSAQPPQQQQQQQQNQQYYDQQSSNQKPTIRPYAKISISDAIALITVRLGRIEQWVMDADHENNTDNSSTNQNISIPDNHKIIDSSVLATIINRIESLEKNEPIVASDSNISTEQLGGLKDDVTKLTEQLTNIGDEVTKHRIELSKQTEQVFRFNRELTETKDILKTFMLKYDMFTQEITNNFSDYETALSELEKRLPIVEDGANSEECVSEEEEVAEDAEGTSISDIDGTVDSKIMTVDLKNIIKQELANA
jgi:hypothetical protein